MITQVALLSRTNVTTFTAVLYRPRRLTAWRAFRTLARITTFRWPLGLHISYYLINYLIKTFEAHSSNSK